MIFSNPLLRKAQFAFSETSPRLYGYGAPFLGRLAIRSLALLVFVGEDKKEVKLQRNRMKKILLVACVLGSAILVAVDPEPENFVDELRRRFREERRRFDDDPEFRAAPRWQQIEMMRGQYANGREAWRARKVLESIKMFTEPKRLAYMALGAGGVFALWHGTKVAAEVAKNYLLIPPLAQKTSIRGWTSGIKNIFVYEDRTMPERSQVMLNDTLRNRIEVLTKSIINAAKNDTFFRHYLFYGPPGTGKTMIAMAMAHEAGLEYIYFSAATLDQYSLEEGVKQIRHLFEYAKAYPKKLMIIMDEADSIFCCRDTCSDKTRTFLNQILTFSGTEQNHYILVALTNRPKDFDTAALSRFGEKLKINTPEHEERKKMFGLYAQKYFIDSHTVNRDNRTVYQWLFSRKPAPRMPLIITEEALSDETFEELAERSEGFVGRDIADVMVMVQNAAYGSEDHTITKEILINAIELKKQQRDELLNDFGIAAA